MGVTIFLVNFSTSRLAFKFNKSYILVMFSSFADNDLQSVLK